MLRLSALLLLATAALPATAQIDGTPRPAASDTVRSVPGDPPDAAADTSAYRVPTPLAAVTSSWSEAFSELEGIARTLDEYPAEPVGQQEEARIGLALLSASRAGALIESIRFTITFASPEAAQEANVAVFQQGYALAYHLGRIMFEATEGPEDGSEPDWHALAATTREMSAQMRVSLAAIGVTPG